MSATLLAYVGNDNQVRVDGLRDADDTYINDATVVCTGVEDADGNAIAGDSFPKTMAYVTSSDGDYRATLQDTLELVEDESYVAIVTADGSGVQAVWRCPFVARARTTR